MGGFMTDKLRERAALGASLALALWLLAASPAAADTFTPTRFDDPPPNKCRHDDCSLREAIRVANNHDGRDEVLLGKGTYEIEIPVTGGDLGISAGDLNVNDPTLIQGQGPSETKIDGNGLDRVFSFVTFGEAVSARALTVRGGDAGAVPEHTSEGGGLIAVEGKLTLRDVVIRGNEAEFGGGISSRSTKLLIRDSTITQNAAGEGGGVDLRAYYFSPSTTVRSSTISGNSAGKGGGILADGFHAGPGPLEPVLDVINSTVAGNMASAEGGGIMADNGATVTLDNATVVDNKADSDNVSGGDAGGVYQHSGAVFNLRDSILARNEVGTSGQGPQCGGTISGDHVGVQGQGGSVCTFNVSPYFNYDPNDLKLGPLAANGGPTKTVKLLSGNGVIGFILDCPARDQRGVERPETGCDGGAFERKKP